MDNTINTLEAPAAEKKDKGFTLVELLIVIVILGILATVTVFAVRGITDKGQDNACAADLKTLQVASEAWFALPASVDVDNNAATAAVVKDADADGLPDGGELVAVGLIREAPTTHTVTNNTITAIGNCA